MTTTEKTAPAANKFDRIFCAIDFSPTADLAVRHAAALAKEHGAQLFLGHVVEPIPVAPYPLFSVPLDAEGEVRMLASERLDAEVAKLAATGLRVQSRIAGGAAGSELIELADSVSADLFVIGTSGLSGIEHLVFGSTAEYVVRRSRCPVLTIHPDDAPPGERVETVLLPSDLSKGAEYAIEAFCEIFEGGVQPRVVVVYADQAPPYLEPVRHAMLERWNEPDLRKLEIEKQLAPTVSMLRERGFEVELLVVDGSPTSVVTKLARQKEADMIVMSTHGRSALLNALLGRTAQRIVHHAPCPVLTVRPPKKS